MKEALFYQIKDNEKVQCILCPYNCIIKNNTTGFCNVRKNIDGKLYSLVYEKPVVIHIDPIEKKPLFHFLPSSSSLSIGTLGCNLKCKHCQNFDISQVEAENVELREIKIGKIIKNASEEKCGSISYTYNEPTIFYEFVIDCAKEAHKKNLFNVMVSNGYINKEPLIKLLPHIDAINIDLKAFTDSFYKKICKARLEPVLKTLKTIHEYMKKNPDFVLEVTNLIIPKNNDSLDEIDKMTKWIVENLSNDIPMHFSAFTPMYKLNDVPRTSMEILSKAYEIAKKNGLKFVYLGNVYSDGKENTYCPNCNELLIERNGFNAYIKNMNKNRCSSCSEKIYGMFR